MLLIAVSEQLLLFLVNNIHVTGVDDNELVTGELKPGNYAKLRFKRKHFNCKLLFDSDVHDLPAPPFMTKPFKTIPEILKKDYTYNERVTVNSWYIENNFPTNRSSGKRKFIAYIMSRVLGKYNV